MYSWLRGRFRGPGGLERSILWHKSVSWMGPIMGCAQRIRMPIRTCGSVRGKRPFSRCLFLRTPIRKNVEKMGWLP